MNKKEKEIHPKKSTVPGPLLESEPESLKDNPDGETVCSPYFSQGCINEDTDLPMISEEKAEEEEKNEKY